MRRWLNPLDVGVPVMKRGEGRSEGGFPVQVGSALRTQTQPLGHLEHSFSGAGLQRDRRVNSVIPPLAFMNSIPKIPQISSRSLSLSVRDASRIGTSRLTCAGLWFQD